LRAVKTKHCSQRVLIVGMVGYNIASYRNVCFKQLCSFQYLRRKVGRFDHRPLAAKGPASPLRKNTTG